MQLLEDRKLLATADAGGGRAPLTDAVDGEHGGVRIRRGVERARRMTHMVLGEQEPVAPIETWREHLQVLTDDVLLEQFFANPDRDRHREGFEAAWREADISFEQPLEF